MSKKETQMPHHSRNDLIGEGKEKVIHAYEDSKDKVSEMYAHTKERANELYDEGVKKVCDVHEQIHDQVKEYTDTLVKTVHEKPLTSLMIAGGIGFILASLLRHK